MKSLYKSPKGQQEILILYDQKIEGFHIESGYLQVVKSFDMSNVIMTGNSSNLLRKPQPFVLH